MSFYYVQIDENDIAYAILESHSEIEADDMIPTSSLDDSVLTKTYVNGEFVEV